MTPKPRKSIGRRLSAIISSPLTARSNAVKPPWSSDEDDGGYGGRQTTATARSSHSKPSVFSMSKNSSKHSNKKRGKKSKKGALRSGRGKRGHRHHRHNDEDYDDDYSSASYYSDESSSLSPLSEDEDESRSSSYSSKTSYTPSISSSDDRHRRGRRRRHHHHSSNHRRKRPLPPSATTSSAGAGDFLTKEELYHLPAKKLRKRCRRAGIDASRMVDKADMVRALYDFYRHQSASRQNQQYGEAGTAAGANVVDLDDQTSQMVQILHEIVPFYGQGDDKSDAVVRDTIQKLPQHALDYPDANSGSTTLIFACQCGAEDLVELLIAKGCDVNARNANGVAALHCACYSDSFSPAIAKLLVDNGAVAEIIEDQFGCSPLHWAGYSGHIELCTLLCHSGANPRTVDNTGCDPIAYAEQSGNEECVKCLISLSDALATPKGPSRMGVTKAATTASKARKLAEVSASHSRAKEAVATNNSQASSSAAVSKELPSAVKVTGGKATVVSALSPLPVDTGPSNAPSNPALASAALTSDTFEERLSALQSKMEEQFIQQLNKIEGRITEQQNQHQYHQQAGQLTPATNGDGDHVSNDGKSLVEMTSKVVLLQTDIGSKDLEIVSLKRDISTLEAKLTKLESQGRPLTSSVRATRDAGVGECSVLDHYPDGSSANSSTSCIGNDNENDVTRRRIRIESDLDAKSKQLERLQEQVADLETQLGLAKQAVLAAQDKQALAERLASAAEEQLAKERVAKDDVLRLLEQTKQGVQVGEEISRSIKEESTRDKETIARLELDLKSLEIVKTDEIVVLQSQIDHKEQKLVADGKKISLMMGEIDGMRLHVASERDKLDVAKREHAQELQQLRTTNDDELTALEERLAKAHGEEKDDLQRQLNEERLSRMEKEVERNDAVEAKENAIRRYTAMENKLRGMHELITEAKVLTGVNERLHRALHAEAERRKTLHNKLEDLKGRIRVYVRIRPLSSTETDRQCQTILTKEDKRTCVMTVDPNKAGSATADPKSWEFDQIFCGSSGDGNSQEDVFRDTSLLVTSAVDGFNVCIFAYGQTGSGKTFTMFGPGAIGSEIREDGTLNGDCGLAPRAAEELFRVLGEREASQHIDVQVSLFELYNDSIRDLLVSCHHLEDDDFAPTPLKIKLAKHSETGMVEVDGAVRENATDASELLSLFARGSQFRTTASTDMNADSSRSHLIASIVTTLTNKRTGRKVRGKLTLVDLAGCERVSKSGATGQQLKEAQSINKSLSALGDVISALTSGSGHVPYRNHPLTMLMSDSLGGSAKTLMFVCSSPADYNRGESSNALDFARRCKNVTNNINASGAGGDQGAQIRALRNELIRMKKDKAGGARRVGASARRPGFS